MKMHHTKHVCINPILKQTLGTWLKSIDSSCRPSGSLQQDQSLTSLPSFESASFTLADGPDVSHCPEHSPWVTLGPLNSGSRHFHLRWGQLSTMTRLYPGAEVTISWEPEWHPQLLTTRAIQISSGHLAEPEQRAWSAGPHSDWDDWVSAPSVLCPNSFFMYN